MTTRSYSAVNPRDEDLKIAVEYQITAFGPPAEFIVIDAVQIDGEDVWPTLTEEQKDRVVAELDTHGDFAPPEPDWW